MSTRTQQCPRFDAVIDLPFGPFGICASEDRVHELVFLPPGTAPVAAGNTTARELGTFLRAWCEAPGSIAPPFPLATRGTPYQRRVWAQIASIPAGCTAAYGELAQRLGSAPRAVGQACGANPFPLIIPCHRVTAASGIGGFANAHDGWLLTVKRWLLAKEANA